MSSNPKPIPLSRQQAFALVDAISGHEELALSASAFENEDGNWSLEANCQGRPDLEKFDQVARKTLGARVNFSAERIDPEIDWVARSLRNLQPVVAGGFYIHAGHNGQAPPRGTIPILIEAARAFGTGHHETTTGCLLAIHYVLKRKQPEAIMDMGTGTGILAIALAKRLQRHVIASDIDPLAIETTRQNASLNGVGQWIRPVLAEGINDREITDNGPYDLMVANILAEPLREMIPDIAAISRPGAAMIMSGILTGQAKKIITACARHDILLDQRIILGEWSTLVFEKT